ncbi:uncharacterized protein F5891DRAFT_1192095 [Suillus fuscotomentosus]|uniref:beta-N-acetylhexosaminidase n=1 Tax=Suillus fuscotomentosus TaxID=1912939 RepID=A0AAD4E0A7_9AGAM|nr:uncharacterized protein F5891DRAFT_1192095 [Suillus fuscotomentosus]KAG1897381.1 hypothetical protein F5891DRAFT_1192095 [Suillus fuscotomentosus]
MTLNGALDTVAQTIHDALIAQGKTPVIWEDAAVVARCFRIIQAPSNYFYLAYTFHPLANLTEAQYELVVGGEQILWSEQFGPQNVDPIVWPRAASSA